MKKLLIYLSLLFSMFLFLFIPGVKAENVEDDVLIDASKEEFSDFVPFVTDESTTKFRGTVTKEQVKAVFDELNYDIETYDKFLIVLTKGSKVIENLVLYNSNDSITYNAAVNNFGSNVLTFNKKVKIVGFFLENPTNVEDKDFIVVSGGNNLIAYREFDSSILESKPKSYNVTFHLNGGIVYDNNYITDDKGSYIIGNKYEDYTTTIQSDKIYEYITNMEFKKDGMDFKGLYYDEKLTLKFNLDQYSEITGDRDFYLKFMYKDVEDFLKNTTFNTYTFNTDYEYAIISLNSKTNKDIYLGLNYIDYSLEIYKYLKNDNEYKQGSVKCLTPYYSKDNKYYYWLESPLDNDYEVLILPKEKFKDNNYEFLLSNNAYVSYTNDLTKVIIKNDDGQDIITNLESSYSYSQDALLKENNIIEIFKKLSENKDNNVFSYFNQIWNYIKRSKLYTYLLTLIIGSLIILIIHVAKR